ncbi:hypothetical protein ACPJHQ_02375 [Rossellomorea sp. H39__3]
MMSWKSYISVIRNFRIVSVKKGGESAGGQCPPFQLSTIGCGCGEEKVFVDYAVWLNSVLVSRGMKPDHLIDNFVCIQEAIEEGEGDERFISYLQAAIRSIRPGMKAETPS